MCPDASTCLATSLANRQLPVNLSKAEIQYYGILRRCTIPKDQYSPVYHSHRIESVAMRNCDLQTVSYREQSYCSLWRIVNAFQALQLAHPWVAEDSSIVGGPSKPHLDHMIHHISKESFGASFRRSAWIVLGHTQMSRSRIQSWQKPHFWRQDFQNTLL